MHSSRHSGVNWSDVIYRCIRSPKQTLAFCNKVEVKHINKHVLLSSYSFLGVVFTFGRPSKNDSGISISANVTLLIAIEAFSIWLVQSRLCCNCFLAFSLRPLVGTLGTGSHHFSSWRWCFLKEDDPSASGAMIPWSTYQNSVDSKLSNISCTKSSNLEWLLKKLRYQTRYKSKRAY